MNQDNRYIIDLMLQEAIEFSQITGTPIHEFLVIKEEELKEWLDKQHKGENTMYSIIVPSFEVK